MTGPQSPAPLAAVANNPASLRLAIADLIRSHGASYCLSMAIEQASLDKGSESVLEIIRTAIFAMYKVEVMSARDLVDDLRERVSWSSDLDSVESEVESWLDELKDKRAQLERIKDLRDAWKSFVECLNNL